MQRKTDLPDLRTLKDIDEPVEKEYVQAVECVDVFTLRNEAIKWIKNFENRGIYNTVIIEKQECLRMNPFAAYEEGYEPVIKWIRYFFNITDEDLK